MLLPVKSVRVLYGLRPLTIPIVGLNTYNSRGNALYEILRFAFMKTLGLTGIHLPVQYRDELTWFASRRMKSRIRL